MENREYIVEKAKTLHIAQRTAIDRKCYAFESLESAKLAVEDDAIFLGYFMDFEWLYDTVYFAKKTMPDGTVLSVSYKIHEIGDRPGKKRSGIDISDAKGIVSNAIWGFAAGTGFVRPIADDEQALWDHAAKQVKSMLKARENKE